MQYYDGNVYFLNQDYADYSDVSARSYDYSYYSYHVSDGEQKLIRTFSCSSYMPKVSEDGAYIYLDDGEQNYYRIDAATGDTESVSEADYQSIAYWE